MIHSALLSDIARLARSKATRKETLVYWLRGLLFLPFLAREFSVKTVQKKGGHGLDAQFDDIYPLF